MQRTMRRPLLLSLVCVVGTFVGQISAQSPTAEIRGQVTDERGVAIVGAKIALLTRDGTEKTSLNDQQGRYAFKSLEAGTFTLRMNAKGFAVYESADLQVSTGQRSVQDIQLRIGPVTETVTVPSERAVGAKPENNADSLVLHGKQLDVLPDDSDDLASALQALAGPAAGPNGGEVFVDGFSGARLPLKSSIREVRVNQNPFSAEFDRTGFGRIEILTKPGTNEFAGEALFNFNYESLNARNPYTLIH